MADFFPHLICKLIYLYASIYLWNNYFVSKTKEQIKFINTILMTHCLCYLLKQHSLSFADLLYLWEKKLESI